MHIKKSNFEKILPKTINFFNKKYIKPVVYVVILVSVLFSIYNLFLLSKFLKNDFYYYLFSSIIQGFLALIGVLGAAFIYRLQLIENNLLGIKELGISWIRSSINSSYNEVSWIKVKQEIDERLENNKDNLSLLDISRRFMEYSEQRDIFKNDMKCLFGASLFNVAFAVLSLPISTQFNNNCLYLVPFILASFSILFSLYLLYLSFVVVGGVLNDIKKK